ncbi:MAG: ATP-binding protein, partial [bacterium]|nr:ATP-binding protein [bacterium]
IRWIVSKSLGFSLLTGFVIWVVASASLLLANTVNQSAAIFIAAFILVAIYQPVANFANIIITKIAHKGSYDPAAATKEVFDIVRKEGDLADLMSQLSGKIKGYFSADEIAFFAFDAKRSELIEASVIGFKLSLKEEAAKLYKLSARRGDAIVEAGELEWKKKFTPEKLAKSDAVDIEYLHRIGVDTLIPCSVEGRLVGLMVFGDRRYDRALRSRDVEFLNLIRSGISPALENAVKFAEMKRLYEQLAEVDKVKTQFIDIVSHRFRTPLSALRWNLETVAEGSERLSSDLREMLTDAGNRANFLSSTLDVLFDMLALENGKLSLNIAQTSLASIVDPIVKARINEAREKGLDIQTTVQEAKIVADAKRLRMVFEVLLANAIAYTPEGSIKVVAGLREDGSTTIQVEDTGIGMTKHQLERVFEKFFRAKEAKLTYADGQGIELYVAREIVRLHKGDILVTSSKKGSTFTVLIPPLKMTDVKKARIK